MWPPQRDGRVGGLTEGQVATALEELREDGFIEGEAHHVFGRREPRIFSKLYPTLYGINALENLGALTAESTPLLRAFLEERDWLELPASHDVSEIAPGVSMTPAEAFFRIRLLEAQGLLRYQRMYETGGHASLMSVKTTSEGRRYLYEIGKGP